MKTYQLSLIAAIAGILLLSACEDSKGPYMSDNPQPPVISSPSAGSSFVLTENQAGAVLFILEWSKPDYGFSAGVTYRIEMDKPENNFADPVRIADVTTTSFSIITGDLNSRLMAAGIPAGEESTVAIRIRASLTADLDPLYSQPVLFAFTPYAVDVSIPEIYVPGGYQSASGYGNDWSPDVAPPLYSFADDGRYEGYVYFHENNSEFKFTAERNWDLNWGDDGADGTLQQNGANIVIAASGYYKINVDLNAFTYNILRTEWGIIGEAAGGWGDADEVAMTYDIDAKVWRATTNLIAGEMKFRANASWDLNYGDDGADGTLQRDGANIVVEEGGNYTVELNLSGPVYSYTLTKN